MSTEKTIRNQAKQSLKGNWGTLISSIIFICVVMVLFSAATDMAGAVFKVFDTDSGIVLKNKQQLYNIILLIAMVLFVFVSPLINGVIKMFYNVSVSSKTEIADLFYYFKSAGRYFKTVVLNVFVAMLYFVVCYGLDCYAYVSAFSGRSLSSDSGFDIMTVAIFGAFIVSVVVKIFTYFVFVHFALFAFAADDSKNIFYYVFGMCGFALKHIGVTIKLLFTFVGWLALCFFVVPAFYVIPYIMTSFATSAKWLFAIEKDRGLLC